MDIQTHRRRQRRRGRSTLRLTQRQKIVFPLFRREERKRGKRKGGQKKGKQKSQSMKKGRELRRGTNAHTTRKRTDSELFSWSAGHLPILLSFRVSLSLVSVSPFSRDRRTKTRPWQGERVMRKKPNERLKKKKELRKEKHRWMHRQTATLTRDKER